MDCPQKNWQYVFEIFRTSDLRMKPTPKSEEPQEYGLGVKAWGFGVCSSPKFSCSKPWSRVLLTFLRSVHIEFYFGFNWNSRKWKLLNPKPFTTTRALCHHAYRIKKVWQNAHASSLLSALNNASYISGVEKYQKIQKYVDRYFFFPYKTRS